MSALDSLHLHLDDLSRLLDECDLFDPRVERSLDERREILKKLLEQSPLIVSDEVTEALGEIEREEELRVERVDLRNSGDTAGPRSQVVGYGSFLFS